MGKSGHVALKLITSLAVLLVLIPISNAINETHIDLPEPILQLDFNSEDDFGNLELNKTISIEGPSFIKSREFGGFYKFDGKDDRIVISKKLSSYFGQEISIAFWVRLISLPKEDATFKLLEKNYGFLALVNKKGNIRFSLTSDAYGGPKTSTDIFTSKTIGTDKWYFITYTHDDDENRIYIY